MHVRRIDPDDLEPLLALYRQLNPDDDPLPPQREVAALWKSMVDDPHLQIFVIEFDGRLVAAATLVLVPNLTRGARPYGLVENVVTEREHRRKGYATAVLQHALEHAWSANCYKVMLLTGSRREETLRVYQKAGFRRGLKTGFVAQAPIAAEHRSVSTPSSGQGS